MKQRHILLILLSLFVSVLQAATVNKQDALQKAQQFVAGRQAAARGGAGQAQSLQSALDNSYYYVFNIGTDGGFVIVSGDDRTPEILGYSDAGTFDVQNIPDNMRAFLQGYADEIQQMPETMPAASRGVGQKKVVRSSINPLIQTTWNQGRPYNNLCPMFLNTSSRCVTGCVATAMAQVMYYHSWPNQVVNDIPAYQCSTNWDGYGRISVEGVPAGTGINWDGMWLDYPDHDENVAESSLSEYEQTANAAVAQLMAYCGRSVQMNYRNAINGGSSASVRDVASALVDYFDYDAGIQYVHRTEYSSTEWDELIYSELNEKRPVLYGGQSSGGGHAFVVDGYDEGYFHVNWGWGGANDCFVLLSEMNPYNNSNIGASSSKDGYSFGQEALIYVQKNIGTVIPPDPVVMGTYSIATTGETNLTRGGDGNFSVGMTMATYNWSGSANTFDIGYGVFDRNGNLLYELTCVPGANLEEEYGYGSLGRTLSFGNGWNDGTYLIMGISRLTGLETWSKNSHSERYILAVIDGDQMSLSEPVTPVVDLAATNMSVEGDKTTKSRLHITATIQNNGTDFNDYIYLIANGTCKGGKIFEAAANESAPFSIEFTTETAGTYSFCLTTDEEGTDTIGIIKNVSISGNGSDNVELSFSVTMNSATVGNTKYILGNVLKSTVTATNNSDENYDGNCSLMLYKWEGGHGSGSGIPQDLFVPAHSSVDLSFEYDVEFEAQYSMAICYKKDGANLDDPNGTANIYYFAKPAVSFVNNDGTESYELATANLTIPATAQVVDLRQQESVTTVNVENASPNCLYLIDRNAETPSGLTQNVIKGETAENVVISDNHDFSAPFNFTATEINYARTITNGTDGTGNGWTTIVLPFDVDKVWVGSEQIDWFHSASDTNGRFWVRKFINDGTNSVIFDFTDKIEANTPYIIAVPGDHWGAAWDLTGKELVFKAANADVSAGGKAVVSGNSYKFTGTTTSQSVSDVFLLNETGSSFVNTASGTVAPFRAYFKSQTLNNVASLYITSPSNQTTAIGQLPAVIATPKSGAIYTLDGRRLKTAPKHGVYIMNGKKMVK